MAQQLKTYTLGISQHNLAGNYACGIISSLWMHALLFCKNPEEFQPTKLSTLLANWVPIGVDSYLTLAEYRKRFQAASRAVRDIKLLRESVKCIYEQNGVMTTNEAFVRKLNAMYGVVDSEQAVYVSLPAALEAMHKSAKASPLRRCVGTFTSGTGYTSCICVFASGSAFFVDSHWNDPQTGERMNGADPEMLRIRNASGILVHFPTIDALQTYLFRTYEQAPLITTEQVVATTTLEPRWSFSLFIGDRIQEWAVNKKKRSTDELFSAIPDQNYQAWRVQQLRSSGSEIHVAEKRVTNCF